MTKPPIKLYPNFINSILDSVTFESLPTGELSIGFKQFYISNDYGREGREKIIHEVKNNRHKLIKRKAKSQGDG